MHSTMRDTKYKNEFEKVWYTISLQEHRSLSSFTFTLKDEPFIFYSINFLRFPFRPGAFIVKSFCSSVSILTLNKKMLARLLLNQLEDGKRVARERSII